MGRDDCSALGRRNSLKPVFLGLHVEGVKAEGISARRNKMRVSLDSHVVGTEASWRKGGWGETDQQQHGKLRGETFGPVLNFRMDITSSSWRVASRFRR